MNMPLSVIISMIREIGDCGLSTTRNPLDPHSPSRSYANPVAYANIGVAENTSSGRSWTGHRAIHPWSTASFELYHGATFLSGESMSTPDPEHEL